MVARLALLLGLTVALFAAVMVAAPAAGAAADPITDGLGSWTPTDGDWTVTNDSDTVGSRGDCAEGRLIQWENEAGETAGLVWARCGDAATAAALRDLTWASNGMFPAVDPVLAFGDGLELVSPYSAFDGLSRLWTQGEWFVTIARSCPAGDAAGCAALTAEYARSLASLVALSVDPVADVLRPADDRFAAWSPPEGNGWRLSSVEPLLGDDLARCLDGASTNWSGQDGGVLQVYWVRCDDTVTAFAFQNEKWSTLTDGAGLAFIAGPSLDRVSRYSVGEVQGVTRSWVQGDLYLNVQRTCPQGDLELCASSTATFARELAALLPGAVSEDTRLENALGEAQALVLIVPVVTFALLWLPQRGYFWWRSRGYSVDAGPTFTSVDRVVSLVRIGRIVRRVIVTALVIVTWSLLFWPAAGLGLWLLAWVFVSPFVLFPLYGWLLRLLWRPHPLIGLARRRGPITPLGALGTLVRGVATAVAAGSVLLYFFATMLLITDRGITPATLRSQLEAGFQPTASPLLLALNSVRWLAHALDEAGTYFLVFLVLLAAPVTLAWFLDRFGQRLARRSLQDTLRTDNRPYFLYLRGFDEDRLRIDESVGRRGFLELFTPFGRPRFEEVLVEYLTLYGPVIAIAGGRQVLSDLGAAKVSLGNDEWRDRVREWSAGARAVVMSATPREVREGLEWEMEHVATSTPGVRLLLVLSPWSRAEVARRWSGFLDRAGRWPLFRPLVDEPMPSGVQVMTWTPDRGWHGYGARRRWDWTYAASIIAAMESGDLAVPGGTRSVSTDKVEA